MAIKNSQQAISLTARTTSYTGTTLNVLSHVKQLAAQLIATKNAGTNPTLDVIVQHSLDGTNWETLLTFTQVTTGTNVVESKKNKYSDAIIFPYIRGKATIGGTDSPSFDINLIIYFE